MRHADYMDTISTPPSFQDVVKTAQAWVGHKISMAFAAMCGWQERALMRHRMVNLDDRMLDDIGLTRDQVRAELRKPFWKA